MRVLAVVAGRRAVPQPAFVDDVARQRFERQSVEHRLQHLSAVHDCRPRRAIPAGLVIGDAQRVRARIALDQIDRAAQMKAAVDDRRRRHRRRIARFVGRQAERELEALGHPVHIARELLEPEQQVAANRGDLVDPDAIDRRRELVGGRLRHLRDDPLELLLRGRQTRRGDRQLVVLLQRAVELRLDLVKQAPARQRIQPLQRRGLFERRETIDGRQQELVGARGVTLQRRQRVGPRRQAMRGERAERRLATA